MAFSDAPYSFCTVGVGVLLFAGLGAVVQSMGWLSDGHEQNKRRGPGYGSSAYGGGAAD